MSLISCLCECHQATSDIEVYFIMGLIGAFFLLIVFMVVKMAPG